MAGDAPLAGRLTARPPHDREPLRRAADVLEAVVTGQGGRRVRPP